MPVPAGFRFRRALTAAGLAVIAEIKRRSPSAGVLAADLDPAELARQYARGGAAGLSVVTAGAGFGGSSDDLRRARAAGLPLLRKDFLTRPDDIVETKALGADALLLIVADLDPARLRQLLRLAGRAGLDALVEVRCRAEIDTALAAGANLIAVNQRSDPESRDFSLDYGLAAALAPHLDREGVVKVAASGIGVEAGTPVAELAAAGYDAALIGQALVTADDPVAGLRQLLADAGL